ncbi:MAG: hypothetical protein JOY68_05155, partial [Candidatus Dormibacteraeota bacterium]|nr:hypothetical protein [Candidatus Dormibacteraeota bacterium]
AASANTERRFARLAMRLREADRVPLDGWRMSADTLFQSTILVAPALLRALVERCAGPVLIGVPDRGVALAIPASAAGAQRFAQRLLREYRESMNPLSPAVLVADGEGLREEPRRRRATTAVMPWLEG